MKFVLLCSLGLLSLCSLALGAPFEQQVETDPELAAGFFEGDIVLDKQKNGVKKETKQWPNGIVYYKINEGFFDDAHLNYILEGMKTIEDASCIRFVEADESTRYYVNITGFDDGCYSSVGYLKRVQQYNLQASRLNSGCFRLGTIVHEFLHTLGFYHQQSASNRDEYVRIVKENIIPNTMHNFNKYSDKTVDDFGEKYDYGSVLHYPSKAFTKNGRITIEPLEDVARNLKVMGQRIEMSPSDIKKLNMMYKC